MDLTVTEDIKTFTTVVREAMGSIKNDPSVNADNYLEAMFHALKSVNPAYSDSGWERDPLPDVEGCAWIKLHRDHVNFWKLDPSYIFETRLKSLKLTIERQTKGLKPSLGEIIQDRGMALGFAWQEASPPLGTKKYDENAYSQSFNHWVLVARDDAMLLKLEAETPKDVVIYNDESDGPPVISG